MNLSYISVKPALSPLCHSSTYVVPCFIYSPACCNIVVILLDICPHCCVSNSQQSRSNWFQGCQPFIVNLELGENSGIIKGYVDLMRQGPFFRYSQDHHSKCKAKMVAYERSNHRSLKFKSHEPVVILMYRHLSVENSFKILEFHK